MIASAEIYALYGRNEKFIIPATKLPFIPVIYGVNSFWFGKYSFFNITSIIIGINTLSTKTATIGHTVTLYIVQIIPIIIKHNSKFISTKLLLKLSKILNLDNLFNGFLFLPNSHSTICQSPLIHL